jgi:hypothetical protein
LSVHFFSKQKVVNSTNQGLLVNRFRSRINVLAQVVGINDIQFASMLDQQRLAISPRHEHLVVSRDQRRITGTEPIEPTQTGYLDREGRGCFSCFWRLKQVDSTPCSSNMASLRIPNRSNCGSVLQISRWPMTAC